MESFFWLQSLQLRSNSLSDVLMPLCFSEIFKFLVAVSMKHFLFVKLYPFVGRGSFFCQLNMLAFASFSITEHIFD